MHQRCNASSPPRRSRFTFRRLSAPTLFALLAALHAHRAPHALPAREAQTLGAGGQSTYDALLKLDESWSSPRGELPPPRDIVFDEPDAPLETPEYDAVVCGGNIDLLATALVLKGLRVAVLEAGELRGREQDWNASRKEVDELVAAGVLTREEADEVIGIEFNPVRCGFPAATTCGSPTCSTSACAPSG